MVIADRHWYRRAVRQSEKLVTSGEFGGQLQFGHKSNTATLFWY
jgi:hypothetical protein